MKIILFEPQIPANTGNIVRTCSVTGAGLILVKPLGFSTSNRMLKRAGLDYWNDVEIEEIDDLESFLQKSSNSFYFFSSKVEKLYTEASYDNESILIFGSETSGLPNKFFDRWRENFYTIPMKKSSRCLNLSNAVSIVLYEALRQNHFHPLSLC